MEVGRETLACDTVRFVVLAFSEFFDGAVECSRMERAFVSRRASLLEYYLTEGQVCSEIQYDELNEPEIRMVMVATPKSAQTTNTDRPAGVTGAKSP